MIGAMDTTTEGAAVRIIAYTYEADYHCADCAVRGFGVSDAAHYRYLPADARDHEGNPVHPVFSWDEWWEPSLVQVQRLTCGTCSAELDRYEPWDAIEADAADEGRMAGEAAASWYFDGNTPDAEYERVFWGIAAGDPAIYDTFPCNPLSGEWADSLLPAHLLQAYGLTLDDDGADDVLAAYEDAYAHAVQSEIERVAAAHIAYVRERDRDKRGW